MRRLLILMLVLGMASVANATLTPITEWTDGICTWTLDIVDLKVYGTGTSVADYLSPLIQQSSGTGRLDPTPLANLGTGGYKDGTYNAAGDLGGFYDPYAGVAGYEGYYYYAEAKDGGSELLPNQVLGLWFEADYTVDENNEFIMTYYDGAAFQVALQIPEPMTVALLGLGGLLLLRRRR